jgi:hypothetical protein
MNHQTFENRVADFKQTEKSKSVNPNPPSSPSPSKNPYKRAYDELLAKCQEWRRTELLQFEFTNDTDNRHYTDFIREVIALGDKYSP